MKKNWSNIRSTLALAHTLDKALMPLVICGAVINAVKPYIAIFLSVYVLDGLARGEAAITLITTAILVMMGNFLLGMVQEVLDKHRAVHVEICNREFEMQCGRKALEMDYPLLESPTVNDIRTRIRNDHNFGAGFYSVCWQLSWLTQSMIGLITAAVVLWPLFRIGSLFASSLSPLLFFGMLGMSVAAALVQSRYVARGQFALMDESAKYRSHYSYFIWNKLDYKTGKDIRLYDAVGLFKHYLHDGNGWYRQWYNKMMRLYAVFGVTGGVAGGLLQGGAYLFVVLRAVTGAISIGSVLKYASAIHNFADNLSNTMNAFSEFTTTCRRHQSTLEYLNVPDALYKGSLPVEKRNDYDYEIEFKDVSFKYAGSEHYALHHFSFQFKVGQKLAVVGLNGSGKTTMIKLLCRLYDPTEGEILLNGYDIRKYDYQEYMSLFSVVFQDFKLFSLPLGQNVAASLAYEKSRAESCLNLAGFTERLVTMEKGLDTPLYRDYDENGGVEISGGEALKVAIARALYKDAPFVVLDEPTAALDPIAEFEVYSKFDTIVGQKTAVYISHRLSSCRFCDDIAVFHEGRLVQRGNHEQLLADKNGQYRALWEAQAQYYTAV